MATQIQYRSQRPITRSKLRMALGKLYFTWRRYLQWIFGTRYASIVKREKLPYSAASHRTLLFRQLRNVDRWLQENKVVNLRLACEKLNGIVLRPGETFSFWRLVGKPARRKGYLKGMVLTNGSFTDGIGGGLCQLSNLIFWISLHTPLTVTERWRHTHDVFPDVNRTQPFGSGATVVYNYVDLQIKNQTPHEYQLILQVGDQDLAGEWRCEQPCPFKYEIFESAHSISHEWWGGYMRHNVIRRRVTDPDNTELADDFMLENHAIMMYEPFLEGEEG